MTRLLAVLAVSAVAVWSQPAFAADPATPTTPDATSPDSSMAPSATTGTLSSSSAGQVVYDQKGQTVGTISSVVNDSSGSQQAVVSVEKFLGMGARDVEIPASALQAKAGGGFTTTLTADQIKALPAYKGQ